ncbi:MAG TPA: VCBS repeat-containing protein [Nannocystis sp.]|jgi:MYXO-CTERM domain-containing protein
MRPTLTTLSAAFLLQFLLPSGAAHAAPWEDATAKTIGVTAEWSNKVELADINGDGLVDILFANGAGYSTPGGAEQSRVFVNQGAGKPFMDVSAEVFPDPGQTRVIKVRDLDADGNVDIVVGNTFETQSWLYMGDGMGGFIDATDKLPQKPASIGDLEFGDVDGDGDLDIVLADWGPGKASQSAGVTQLWLGDGLGGFTDATASNMPDIPVAWSWEMELADVDNDHDLDVLVSCKSCTGSYMFHNDGMGMFTDASAQMPQFANNYEFEAIDLNGDDFLDLITVNDGPEFREHIFVGDGMGGFTDATAELWPDIQQPPGDDNMIAYLDVESDGDADFVICGLFGGLDRLLVNDGKGALTLEATAFAPATSSGSLGIAVADLNGDKKLDVVFAEGEAPDEADRVFLGVDVPVDTAAPKISLVDIEVGGNAITARARIHDNKSPVMPHDFTSVELTLYGDGAQAVFPMIWYGEGLWRAFDDFAGSEHDLAIICAVDAAGNEACSDPVRLNPGEDTDTDPGVETSSGTTSGTTDVTTNATGETGETPTTGDMQTSADSAMTEASGNITASAGDSSGDTSGGEDKNEGGCGCRSEPTTGGAWLLALGGLLLVRRRRG